MSKNKGEKTISNYKVYEPGSGAQAKTLISIQPKPGGELILPVDYDEKIPSIGLVVRGPTGKNIEVNCRRVPRKPRGAKVPEKPKYIYYLTIKEF